MHPVGICAVTVSESLSIAFCELICMCFKSRERSRSVSFGVTDKIAADGGLLASLIVNCVLMTAAVPIADKTQTSSLKLKYRIDFFLFSSLISVVFFLYKLLRTYEILVISVYPKTTLQPRARACDRISIRNSVHQKSLVSGSSGFGTRSNSLTERAHTVDPNCRINPIGYLHSVRNGYSNISKFSRFSGVLRCGVPANRNIPAVVLGSAFNEHPGKSIQKCYQSAHLIECI